MSFVVSVTPLVGHPWPSVCSCTRAHLNVFQDLYLRN